MKRESHVERRKRELREQLRAPKPHQSRPYKRRLGAPITITRTDADTLMHIASGLEHAGLHNFAAELARIAAAATVAETPASPDFDSPTYSPRKP